MLISALVLLMKDGVLLVVDGDVVEGDSKQLVQFAVAGVAFSLG